MRLLTTLSFFFLISSAWADSIQDLNQKIREADAHWEAGETSVSSLTAEEVSQMLDASLDPHPEVRFEVPESFQALALPATLDWRNKDGKSWMSPIRNQASCGSCLAFAATAAVESQYRITQGQASTSIRLSPQFMFSCGGGVCKKGWYPEQAAKFLVNTGVPDEACMPYAASSGRDIACNKACGDAAKRSVKITSYSRPTANALKIETLRQALQKGPLVTTMSVYSDFMNYRRGIYKRVSNSYNGGHAIVLIGYNHNERYFIIRNSWSTGWGESGYGRISYDDTSGIGASTWKYEVPKNRVFALPLLNAALEDLDTQEHLTASPTRQPASAQDVSLVLHPSFQVRSNRAEVELLLENLSGDYEGDVSFHMVFDGREKVVPTQMSGNTLKVYLNTALLKEGDWEFYASTVNAAGSKVSTSKVALRVVH